MTDEDKTENTAEGVKPLSHCEPAALKVTRTTEYGVQSDAGAGYTVVTAASEEEAVLEYCRLTGLTSGSVTVARLPLPWPCHLDTRYRVEPATTVEPRSRPWPKPRWKGADSSKGPGRDTLRLSGNNPADRLRAFRSLRDMALRCAENGTEYSDYALEFLNSKTIGARVTDAQIVYAAILALGVVQEEEEE